MPPRPNSRSMRYRPASAVETWSLTVMWRGFVNRKEDPPKCTSNPVTTTAARPIAAVSCLAVPFRSRGRPPLVRPGRWDFIAARERASHRRLFGQEHQGRLLAASRYVQVTAGWTHTCGLTGDGAVMLGRQFRRPVDVPPALAPPVAASTTLGVAPS